MPYPNKYRVTEFLAANPHGAYGWQIASHLDVCDNSMHQTMLLMQEHMQVTLVLKGKNRAHSLWRLTNSQDGGTPAVFRAMETLRAMQEAARQRLTKQPMLEAA